MDNVIRFEGRLSPEIYYRAQQLHSRRRRAFMALFGSAAVLLAIFQWYSGGPDIEVAAFGCGGIVLLTSLALRRFRFNRAYDKSPYLHETFTGTISHASYSAESAVGSAVLPWSKFVKVVTSDDMVLMYRGTNLFNIVAKEFFTSEADWQQAKAIALEMIGHPSNLDVSQPRNRVT